MDMIAQHHTNKKSYSFWKCTNKLNQKPGLPVSVAGVNEPTEIANVFMNHFKVEPPQVEVPEMLHAPAVETQNERVSRVSVQKRWKMSYDKW